MTESEIKLYSCSSFFLLVYPTARSAASAIYAAESGDAPAAADYWSTRLNCNVRYLTCGEQFLFLDAREKKSETPVRILSETGILGYIIPCKSLGITAHLEK
jgi:hypothetical protein